MPLVARLMLILVLLPALGGVVSAQEPPASTATTATAAATPVDTTTTTAATSTAAESAESAEQTEAATTTAPPVRNSYEVRNLFTNVLRQLPPDLAPLLKLEPTLMTNDQFLAGYPELAKFLAAHPEVARNPRFYLAEFPYPGGNSSALDEIIEAMLMAILWLLSLFTLSWLIRTIIEQRRWNKLTKTQSEVHNKILDRFGSSEELLAYIKTSAGSKFLEAAPIPLRTEPEPSAQKNLPMTRIMWSIQLGVVAAVASLGILLVSLRFEGETSQGLFAIGAIIFTIGAGFIASAVVSLILSYRLGLWQGPPASPDSPAAPTLDERGVVR